MGWALKMRIVSEDLLLGFKPQKFTLAKDPGGVMT